MVGTQIFDKAFCDLDASVSVMPKAVFNRLNYSVLAPTPMQLQLADSIVQHPEGIAEDILVRVLLAFLTLNRIWIPQVQRITAVALHLGVFQGIVYFLREVLWLKSIEELNDKLY